MQIRSLGINSATRFFEFCSSIRESLMKDGLNGHAMEDMNILTLRFLPILKKKENWYLLWPVLKLREGEESSQEE